MGKTARSKQAFLVWVAVCTAFIMLYSQEYLPMLHSNYRSRWQLRSGAAASLLFSFIRGFVPPPRMIFVEEESNGPAITFDSLPAPPSVIPLGIGSKRVPRRKIAVSLITMLYTETLEPALQSLAASDIMDHDTVVFYWCNLDDSVAAAFVRGFSNMIMIEVPNTYKENMGIVVPRIRIMEAILKHPKGFDFVLEMHDDMYFFPRWFNDLLKYDRESVGILMPFIFNSLVMPDEAYKALFAVRKDIDPDNSVADLVSSRVLYDACVQIHPWLLKRKMLEQVGYYDPIFAPHQAEDDDFYYRCLGHGWRSYAVRASWALHVGGMTRGHYLDYDLDHETVFNKKHNISIDWYRRDMVNRGCHPAIPKVKPTLTLPFQV